MSEDDGSTTAPGGVAAATGDERGDALASGRLSDAQLGELATGRHRHRHRRWPLVVAGIAIGVAATAATVWFANSGDDGASAGATASADLATATVEVGDLVRSVEYEGTLGFGDPVSISVPTDGTVTTAASVGTILNRGAVIASVDNTPVVLLYGPVPAWRDLSTSSDDGADILQLQANLVALGNDPDGQLEVDGDFGSVTARAVERWQEDLGMEPTGEVDLGAVAFVAGPAAVTEGPVPGDAVTASRPLAQLTPRETVTAVVAGDDGVVGVIAPIGTPVGQGDVLYELDGVAVVALTAPDPIGELMLADRDLEEIEAALVFFGYDPDKTVVIDGEWDLATGAAIGAWQADLGLPVTGIADAAHHVVLPVGSVVTTHGVTDGETVDTGRFVLDAAASSQVVTLALAAADEGIVAVGDTVEIILPDGATVGATVAAIGSVATTPEQDADAEPTIEVSFTLDGDTGSTIDEGPVTIRVVEETAADVLIVPTRALVALAEGGQAVEVVDGETTRLVAVETGMFQDGLVEASGEGIAAGVEVVVPR